jgi:hypothetical protein
MPSVACPFGVLGSGPAAAEVPIQDGNAHDTPWWNRLVIEKIVKIRFLGNAINDSAVGTLSRQGLGIGWLGNNLAVQMLRLHEKVLRFPILPAGPDGKQTVSGIHAGRSGPNRPRIACPFGPFAILALFGIVGRP